VRDRSKPPRIAEQTLSRRSLLEWLGGAAVLGLNAELLQACATSPAAGGDARQRDGGALDAVRGDAASGGYPFAPGEAAGGVFEGWGERTVDPQDLQKILASWRLRVDGMVETPRSFSFVELASELPRQEQITDFHCVEGWSVLDVPWTGVRIAELLARVKPLAGATHVTFHTVGGAYNESLPLAVALEPRTLLGYGIAGATLPLRHGFPLRVVVPRLLGYKNAKYVERVELSDRAVHGFWVAAGYPYDGEVPPARLRDGKY
jgi:DMSO/TMAO reductase YedYZ molybdopterin-dependent catalytic subunit